MTTPSKAAQKRPCIGYEAGDASFYSKDEADAIFESLETELTQEREKSARLEQAVVIACRSGKFGRPESAAKKIIASLEDKSMAAQKDRWTLVYHSSKRHPEDLIINGAQTVDLIDELRVTRRALEMAVEAIPFSPTDANGFIEAARKEIGQ